jgi:hypothetical protein
MSHQTGKGGVDAGHVLQYMILPIANGLFSLTLPGVITPNK